MDEFPKTGREASLVTCMVHQRLGAAAADALRSLGARTVLVESARCVRQRMRARLRRLPGLRVNLVDAPMEVLRTTVARGSALPLVDALATALDLQSPGRGSVFAQDVLETSRCDPAEIAPVEGDSSAMLRDLALITGILSMAGSGELLAAVALKLGAAVPVVGLGTGTGIRERLGLLRVTIPPEKELVRLLVPAHDAAGLQRLLVEEGHLDRPGGGFLYQTPVRAGVADPLVRIGRQEHAASMEQIIAAIDDLKRGTAWRKRFAGMEPADAGAGRFQRNHREVVFICAEGQTGAFVDAAMRAGAPGATSSRVRCLDFANEGGIAARERGILCVPAGDEQPVLEALCGVAASCPDPACRLQVLDAPSVFSHQRR